MYAQPIRSLWCPWWDWWDSEGWRNSPLPWAFRQLWVGNLQEICDSRGSNYSAVARAIGRDYHWLRRQRRGDAYTESCTPVLEFYKMARHLKVEVDELLPRLDEVYTLATRKLFEDARKLDSEKSEQCVDSGDSRIELGRTAAQAYVKYHSQDPSPRPPDSLDPAAAEKTYRALADRFRNSEEAAAVLLAAGRVIDSICFALGGAF